MMISGRYYIGDLCYVFNDEEWDEICSLTIIGNECINGEFIMKNGVRFAMYSTKYGDGEYLDETGRKYGVDSGTIGCVMVSDCNPDKLARVIEYELGQFEAFVSDFATSEHNGLIEIGHVEIETNYDWLGSGWADRWGDDEDEEDGEDW